MLLWKLRGAGQGVGGGAVFRDTEKSKSEEQNLVVRYTCDLEPRGPMVHSGSQGIFSVLPGGLD